MLTIAYYLLKVMICSGILLGYYRLALHNKVFHHWNRFYLLTAVVISISFPLIRINVQHAPAQEDNQIIKVLNVVTTGDEFVYEANNSGRFHLNGEQVLTTVCLGITLVLMVMLVISLLKLKRLAKHNPRQKIHQINVIQTETKGTPFSFFRYIFWNPNISMRSAPGKKIFAHEMVHVTEWHSADRLFMKIILVFFWSNPFFWLIQREMNMIHEFIADAGAIGDNDTAAFAEMILHTVYPQQASGLTSSFFSSSIKRRLRMLTQMQNPGISYISRILALPLLVVIFTAFSIKTKPFSTGNIEMPGPAMHNTMTVVIDAGHGGEDAGAVSSVGIREKDITLSLSKKMKAISGNTGIKVILSRERDNTQSVKDKIDFAAKQKPDLFISLHVGWANQKSDIPATSGFEIFVSGKNAAYRQQSQLLGSLVSDEIAAHYSVAPQMKVRSGKGIWLLDAPEISYPALLINCGYLNDAKDLAFISNEKNLEKIAGDIIRAIERFARMKGTPTAVLESGNRQPAQDNQRITESSLIGISKIGLGAPYLKAGEDSIPAKIKSVDITGNNQVIIIYQNDKAEKITQAEAIKRGVVPAVKTDIELISGKISDMDSVLYFLDGVEISKSDMEQIIPSDIETISVLKGEQAIRKFGNNARNGVVEIELKRKHSALKVSEEDKVFQKVEQEAMFPGGDAAWNKYIAASLKKVVDSLQSANKTGTCVVQFIVDTEGNLSEIEPITMKGTLLAASIVNALEKGPKWIPAIQNGHKVKAYHRQPVTFNITH